MALKVFRGNEATRSYENEFFREFAGNLVELFKQEKLNGILIGFPKVPSMPNFQPDSVLITGNRLVIIDFKNHGGKIRLPDEKDFTTAPWWRNGIMIAGGASANPFVQLQKQQKLMRGLVGKKVYTDNGITCLVCFQKDGSIEGEVPGRYQAWFAVSSKYQYLNRLRDLVEVHCAHPAEIKKIAEYFEAKPYKDYFAVNLAYVDAVAEAEQWKQRAEECEAQMRHKIHRLQKELILAKLNHQNYDRIRRELEKARKQLEEARREAREAEKAFREKSHELEMARQKALSERAKADRAVSEADAAASNAETAASNARSAASNAETAASNARTAASKAHQAASDAERIHYESELVKARTRHLIAWFGGVTAILLILIALGIFIYFQAKQ